MYVINYFCKVIDPKSGLSLRHSSKFSCGDKMAIECHFVRAAKDLASLKICTGLSMPSSLYKISCAALNGDLCALVSLHICAGKVTDQCNKYQDLLCWQQRLLGVCTFAQARLSLLHSIKKKCAGWNGDLCNVYVNSEWCGESAPATTGLLCSHQCVVSMRQKMLLVRCNKISSIKHLLVYQEKKTK